jgi:hypothetical protein
MIKKINIKGFVKKSGNSLIRVKPSLRRIKKKVLVNNSKNLGLVKKRFNDLTKDWPENRLKLLEKHKTQFGLADGEVKALALYVGNDDYIAINAFARKQKFGKDADISEKTAEAIAEELSSGLKKLPPLKNRTTLYRSEALDIEDALKLYKEGSTIENNFFTSTSYRKNSLASNSVQVEIIPSIKTKGKNVSQFGLSDRRQYEVLFDKNTKFKVEKVETASMAQPPSNYQIAREWGDVEIFRPIFEDGDEALLKLYGVKNGSHADFIKNPRQEKYNGILSDFYPGRALKVVLKELIK